MKTKYKVNYEAEAQQRKLDKICRDAEKTLNDAERCYLGVDDVAEWSGDGLPPVGCECEVMFGDDDHPQWHKITFYGVAAGHLVFSGEGDYKPVVSDSKDFAIRPLRSPRDRWVEAVCAAMIEAYRNSAGPIPSDSLNDDDREAYARAIYDAGLAEDIDQ